MSDAANRLQDAADTLGEHYDSVIVIVTRSEVGETGGTVYDWAQCGNALASKGAVREWIIMKAEDTRIYRRDRARE